MLHDKSTIEMGLDSSQEGEEASIASGVGACMFYRNMCPQGIIASLEMHVQHTYPGYGIRHGDWDSDAHSIAIACVYAGSRTITGQSLK